MIVSQNRGQGRDSGETVNDREECSGDQGLGLGSQETVLDFYSCLENTRESGGVL